MPPRRRRAPAETAPDLWSPPAPTRPPPELPAWFERPRASTVRPDEPSPRMSLRLAYQIAEDLVAGRLVMPTWQRGAVWSTAQRIAFLDTMIRRIPSGTIVLWQPPYGQHPERRLFPGAPEAGERPWFVVDGQQRLTTLLMAARGELGVCWNGIEWAERGVVSAQMAIGGHPDHELYSAMKAAGIDGDLTLETMCYAVDRVGRYDFSVCLLEGFTEAQARATYARMAACGTPHEGRALAEVVAETALSVGSP